MDNANIDKYRYFLKESLRKEYDFAQVDQNKGIKPPPVVKPFDSSSEVINLSKREELENAFPLDLFTAITRRKSRRKFLDASISLKELSFLLYSTQGIRQMLGKHHTLRTVPSAGARHAIETYLYIRKVDDLEEGIYRYLPLDHQLLYLHTFDTIQQDVINSCFNQQFSGRGAVTFFWAAIPYRMEWRYGLAAHKAIVLDAGHVCQNLYLACEALNCGTCAIGAYDQEYVDKLLKLDGKEEFVIYIAPVGRLD